MNRLARTAHSDKLLQSSTVVIVNDPSCISNTYWRPLRCISRAHDRDAPHLGLRCLRLKTEIPPMGCGNRSSSARARLFSDAIIRQDRIVWFRLFYLVLRQIGIASKPPARPCSPTWSAKRPGWRSDTGRTASQPPGERCPASRKVCSGSDRRLPYR